MPTEAQLAADPWLRDLSPELTAQLRGMSVRRALRHGERLYARGESAEGLYGVVRGRIRISVATAEGKEVLLTFLGPGAWFGEVSLFDGLPRPQDAHAVGDTDLLVLPRERFLPRLEQQPALFRGFARLLCRRLRTATEYIEDALTLPLAARLGKRLLDLSRVHGVVNTQGVLIDLELPQEELANMLGATRQSVSKELKQWETQGLLKLSYRHVTLLQPPALEALVRKLSGRSGP